MENKSSRSGISFAGLLTILFIGLRLGHIIDWSWWWVLCPIWGPAAFILTLSFVAFLIGVAGEMLDRRAAYLRSQAQIAKAKLK